MSLASSSKLILPPRCSLPRQRRDWSDPGKSFLAAGGLHTFDVVAFHGYGGGQAEQTNAIVDAYREVMGRNNLCTMPLWDTECSWGETYSGDDDRAAFLSKYLFLQWFRRIDRVIWYAYDGDPKCGVSPMQQEVC